MLQKKSLKIRIPTLNKKGYYLYSEHWQGKKNTQTNFELGKIGPQVSPSHFINVLFQSGEKTSPLKWKTESQSKSLIRTESGGHKEHRMQLA